MIRVRLGLEGGALLMGLASLQEEGETPECSLLLSLCEHTEERSRRGHSEKGTVCKLGRDASSETDPDGTLILDVHPPDL